MAETKLTFNLTMVDGSTDTQTITVPSDGDGKQIPTVEQFIMAALQQYATVGMLKKDIKENKFILVTAPFIRKAECEVPTLLSASIGDITSILNDRGR